jgi:hypothetical protein
MPNPAIPGTPQDRTGTTGILRRALREIARRWVGLQADVLALFDGIGRLQVNDLIQQPAPTIYTLTPQQLAQLSADLQETVRRWIADDRQPADQLWWSPYSAEAAQLGAAQSVANLSALSEVYAAARSIEAVVYSEPFRNRVAMAQIRSLEHWTGTAAAVRAELAQIIGRAVADGKNPKAVRTEIMERLGVSKSRATLYAQTEVTGVLREARWAEADYAAETFDMKIGLLWTSALIPTTRPWHASRSGHVFTSGEVRAFYQVRGNRFACHCSTTEALLDADGKPILTDRLKATMRAERERWEKAQAENA